VLSTGDVKVSPSGFEFVLEDMLTGKKITQKTGYGGKAFFNQYYTAEDAGKSFSYALYEMGSGVPGIHYDEKVYDIRVDVTLVDKTPVATVYLDGVAAGGSMVVADFTNVEISGIGGTTVTLNVNKNVEDINDDKPSLKGYKFILEDVTVYAGEIPESERIRTDKSDKHGKASFDLTYTSADIGKTFSYKLYEEAGDNEDMEYDTTVYDIQVTVGMAEIDGVYQLTAYVTCDGVAIDDLAAWAAEFTNGIYGVGGGEEEDAESGFEGDVPKTGDGSNLPLWFSMMLISALACLVLLGAEVRDRRRG